MIGRQYEAQASGLSGDNHTLQPSKTFDERVHFAVPAASFV